MGNIEITNHAYEAGRKRLKLSKKAIRRLAENAIRKGVLLQNANGIKGKCSLVSPGTETIDIIHGEFKFVFKGEKLITIMPIKTNFRRKMYYGR
jgi:hypothetical protein